MKLFKKAVAELFGTFVLVALACGTALSVTAWGNTSTLDLAAKDAVIALSFGLCIVAMAYSVGNVSGCHINPAVSFGVLIYNFLQPKEKRNFHFVDFLVYIVAQVAGAFLACLTLLIIFGPNCGFAANQASRVLINLSNQYYLTNALIIEAVLTGIFVFAVIGVTTQEKYKTVAGLVVGGTLTLVHLIGIPLTGTSVNPARSIAPAIFAYYYGGNLTALDELWVFIAGPMIGALVAALLYWFIVYNEKKEPKKVVETSSATPLENKKVEITTKVEEEPSKETPKEVKAVAAAPLELNNEKPKLEIKRISFEEKLKKAGPDLRKKYKDIKAVLDTYGLKSRFSFDGDTYRLHRVEYCFITIRGKSLKVYFKLDPKKFINSPIPVKDESEIKKRAEAPAVIKVRSDLSARRAIELVEQTMLEANIEKVSK